MRGMGGGVSGSRPPDSSVRNGRGLLEENSIKTAKQLWGVLLERVKSRPYPRSLGTGLNSLLASMSPPQPTFRPPTVPPNLNTTLLLSTRIQYKYKYRNIFINGMYLKFSWRRPSMPCINALWCLGKKKITISHSYPKKLLKLGLTNKLRSWNFSDRCDCERKNVKDWNQPKNHHISY